MAIDVVAAGVDVLNGGSISSAAIGVGVGIGVGAGVGAALGTVSILPPVGAAVLTSLITGVAVNAATEYWEGSVPLDVREAIDAGDWDYLFA